MRQSIRRKAPMGALARAVASRQGNPDSGPWTPTERSDRDRTGPQPIHKRPRRMSERTASILWLTLGAGGMAALLLVAYLIYQATR
jgi:hypothetical protein